MAPAEFRPRYHPADFDDELRVVLEDVRAGRWLSMRELLVRTGKDWPLRTSRSQVLGTAAAKSTVVAAWLAEEPHCPEGLLMRGRVAVVRAARAHRQEHPDAGQLAQEARRACEDAARAMPEDPVPWVCLMALGPLDVRHQQLEYWVPPWEPLLPHGPWGLLREVWQRHRGNREAFHRMLQFLTARQSPTDGMTFARWVGEWSPAGSPLLVLPLYAHVQAFLGRGAHGRNRGLGLYWSSENVTYHTTRALQGWFDHRPAAGKRPLPRSLLDLNHLAYALYSGGFDDGARVFTAMGPFATPSPWKEMGHDPGAWEDDFLRARSHCLRSSPGGSGRGPGRR